MKAALTAETTEMRPAVWRFVQVTPDLLPNQVDEIGELPRRVLGTLREIGYLSEKISGHSLGALPYRPTYHATRRHNVSAHSLWSVLA